MRIISSMNFLATQVYREGNRVADTLTNLGLSLVHPTVWLFPPNCILASLALSKSGMPNFSLVSY